MSTAKRRFISVMILGLVALLGGCGGEEASLETINSEPLPTKVPDGTKLVFADQNEEIQTLMTASGQQQQLASDTSYANFIGGPEILEAMRAGAVDLAYVGDTPPIQAQTAGDSVLIVAAVQWSAAEYKLAVRPGLEVDTLEDLAGQRIGYAEGTGRQPFVLRALEEAGLSTDDVELVPIDADAMPDAIASGEIDVAPLNEPHFTRFMRMPGASAVPADLTRGLSNGLHYLYARGDALADDTKAAAIRDFVQRWVVATQWAQDNSEKWIRAYYIDTEDLTHDEGKQVIESKGDIAFPPLNDELIAQQQETVDVIYRAGDIPEQLDAADEFVVKFDPAIAEAVEKAGARRELP
jgi:sulfonate transport system substrate-binding protein